MIKLGSRGDEVKMIQQILKLPVDGSFGPKTEQSVKDWQKNHGLKPDGIIGPKTMSLLMPKQISFPNLIYKPIKTHITNKPYRPIDYIVIHYTAGKTSKAGSALSTVNVFNVNPASADFIVDDNTVVQVNPDLFNYCCWAVGDKGVGKLKNKASNKNCIHIEICSNLQPSASPIFANHKGWYFSDEALNNAVSLCKFLMNMLNIDKDHVIRHYDVTGKLCPGLYGWNDHSLYELYGKVTSEKNNNTKWLEFKSKL